MLNFRNSSLAAALLAVTGLASVPDAQADALASAVLRITNFKIYKGSGETNLVNFSDFSGLSFTDSADASATLNGTTDSDSVTNPSNIPGIDITARCVGACPAIGENAFPYIQDPVTTTFAAADQLQKDSPIGGLPDGAGGTVPVGAEISQAGYVSLAGAVKGSTTANNGLSGSFTFTASSALDGQVLTLAFDALAGLEAFVSNGEFPPSFAQAEITTTFQITDLSLGGTKILDWQPGSRQTGLSSATEPFSLNETIAANAPFANGLPQKYDNYTAGFKHFAGTLSTPLVAGHSYQLSFTTAARADAQAPEPAVLALFGIGLLGLGMGRRRLLVA